MSRRDKDEARRVEIEDGNENGELEPEVESLAPSIDELQDEVERLRTELEAERKRADEEHDRQLRALADFANYRRRHQEEYKQATQFATQELVLKILPAIDNLERALGAAKQGQSLDSLVEGVNLTVRQLRDILERQGVERIEAIGQEFDPMLHEAVMRDESDEYPENTVVEEFQPGYKMHDRVIRPAQVKVATSPE